MGAHCHPEALIAARQIRRRAAGASILSRAAAGMTWATLLMKASAEETANKRSDWRGDRRQIHHARNANLKVLLVIGLVALLFLLLYRRLRPYLRIVRNFLNSIRQFQQINASQTGRQRPEQQSEKLVQCEACGTWVPIGRALSSGSSGTFFCSADCQRGREVKRRSAS